MRIAVFAIPLVLALILPAQASVAGELRIASWNLEHLKDSDGEGCIGRTGADYAAVAGQLAELNADIVALQEVENAAAAHRVFPSAQWRVEMSSRPATGNSPRCRKRLSARLGHLATGFAIRRGIAYRRNADLKVLGMGKGFQRWGTDITVSQDGRQLRLLSVHLISRCWGADEDRTQKRRRICDTLRGQMSQLKDWADARRAEGTPFVILGDFNRRLALKGCWCPARSANCRAADRIPIIARYRQRCGSVINPVPEGTEAGGPAAQPGGAVSVFALTIPVFGDCPAPRTTQPDLASAARPGPGDEFLQAVAADGARNQGVADHERGGPADAEDPGQADRFVEIFLDGGILHVAAKALDVETDAAGNRHHLVFRQLPARAHDRDMEFEVPALLLGGHRRPGREPRHRTEDGKLLPDDAQPPVGLHQVPHRLQRPFAVAALVVEELDEGDIALRVAGDRRHRVGPQRLVVLAERGADAVLLPRFPLRLQTPDVFFDDLGVFDQVFPDDLADRLLVETRGGRRLCAASRDECRGGGDRQQRQQYPDPHGWRSLLF